MTSQKEASIKNDENFDPLVLYPLSDQTDRDLQAIADTRLHLSPQEMTHARNDIRQAVKNYVNKYDSHSYAAISKLGLNSKDGTPLEGEALRKDMDILDRNLLVFKAITAAEYNKKGKPPSGIVLKENNAKWNELVESGRLNQFQLLDSTDLSSLNKKKMLVTYLR